MAEIGKYKKSLLNETNAELVNARKNKTKKRIWLFSIFLLILIGGIVYFAWYPKFLIKIVSVSGNRVLISNKLEGSINEYLNGRFLYILPNKNAFIFNSSDLEKFLLKKHPTIKNINVNQNIPSGLSVHIDERQPNALWCNVTPNNCVFIDTVGYAYDIAPYFSKPLFTVYELPGASVTKNVLDTESFNFSQKIINGFGTKNILVQKIKPTGGGVFEFEIILDGKVSPTVLVTNISIGSDETLGRVYGLMNSEDVLKHSSTFLKKIDVRYGNQVVYTFY